MNVHAYTVGRSLICQNYFIEQISSGLQVAPSLMHGITKYAYVSSSYQTIGSKLFLILIPIKYLNCWCWQVATIFTLANIVKY